jgi:hypothetical protein
MCLGVLEMELRDIRGGGGEGGGGGMRSQYSRMLAGLKVLGKKRTMMHLLVKKDCGGRIVSCEYL